MIYAISWIVWTIQTATEKDWAAYSSDTAAVGEKKKTRRKKSNETKSSLLGWSSGCVWDSLTHISQEWMEKKWMLNDACNDCATIPPNHITQEPDRTSARNVMKKFIIENGMRCDCVVEFRVERSHQSLSHIHSAHDPLHILLQMQHYYWWLLKTQRSRAFISTSTLRHSFIKSFYCSHAAFSIDTPIKL